MNVQSILEMRQGILFATIAVLLSFSCNGEEHNKQVGNTSSSEKAYDSVDGLVAYWDFSGEDYLLSKGEEKIRLLCTSEEHWPKIVEDKSTSSKSLHFDGNDYLYIPYVDTGKLNIKSGQVTVVAKIKWIPGQIGFVGGMWNEYADGGMRQYGLFVSLPYYNGADRVCGHISFTGKPTPPFPYSVDYSASAQRVPGDEWCMVGFTYDGEYIRSYYNGICEPRDPELINHTIGFEGYPNGLVQSKNPYYFPYGIGDNGSDFTIGAVMVGGKIGNFFRGNIESLAVYDRALSSEEMKLL